MLRESVGDVCPGLCHNPADFSPSYIQTPPARFEEKSLLPEHKSSGYNAIAPSFMTKKRRFSSWMSCSGLRILPNGDSLNVPPDKPLKPSARCFRGVQAVPACT